MNKADTYTNGGSDGGWNLSAITEVFCSKSHSQILTLRSAEIPVRKGVMNSD